LSQVGEYQGAYKVCPLLHGLSFIHDIRIHAKSGMHHGFSLRKNAYFLVDVPSSDYEGIAAEVWS
jgi:hypothetical protein